MTAIKKFFICLILLCLTACAGGSQQTRNSQANNQNALKSAQAHTNLGAAYLQKNKLEIALEEFNEAVRVMPSYAAAYNGLAMVRSALNQDEEAEYNFKKSIELDPSSSSAHNNYGTFLCSRGRYTESIDHFLQAVSNPLYSTPHLAYANAGICAKRDNDYQRAQQYLNKALQLQPLTHNAAQHLAEIQLELGSVAVAQKTLQNALVASPSAEVLWLGVKIARALNDRNSEASYSLELRRRFPNAKETQLLLSGE